MCIFEIFEKIDFTSPVAFYIQVKDTIRSAIESNALQPGDLIPGENELCDFFSVSRTVIRQALDDLVHEGLIIRKKGRGTFVCEPKILEKFGQEIIGFYKEMTSKGYQIKTEILDKKVVSANEELAKNLSLLIGEPLVYVKRLRYILNDPMVIVSSFLPFVKCGNLMEVDLSNISLYTYLKDKLGLNLNFGKRSIEAVLASSEQANILGITKGTPLLFINSIIYLDDGTPIEYYRSYYRADRYKFEVELIKMRKDDRSNKFIFKKNQQLPSSEGLLKNSNT